MQSCKSPNRLTAERCGSSVRLTWLGALRQDNQSEFGPIHPHLLATRVDSRRRSLLHNGGHMFSQRVRSTFFRFVFISFLALLSLLATGSLAAQDSAPAVLTLDQAIQVAITNNL